MSSTAEGAESKLYLKLAATSANLGPGFDTLALALAFYLEIEAKPAESFSIEASGRNVDICSRLNGNLLLDVYVGAVRRWVSRGAPPLALIVRNGIPLGMGCGSSAASRLAGLALASHFGGLGWSRDRILAEACQLEGHPDNAAACWLGGFVASGWDELAPQVRSEKGAGMEMAKNMAPTTQPVADPGLLAEETLGGAQQLKAARTELPAARPVAAIAIAPPPAWHALLVLPAVPLATTASRAVLPERYSRRDTVDNLQRVALLTAAFASGRGDLLRGATADSLHQPYRGAVCPLLPLLLPLAGRAGILSVTLSGAGPAVLLLLESRAPVAEATALIRVQVGGSADATIEEIIDCPLGRHPAEMRVECCVTYQELA